MIMNALNRIAAMEIRAGLDENQALMLLGRFVFSSDSWRPERAV